jgi:serine/threonine-protein kinase
VISVEAGEATPTTPLSEPTPVTTTGVAVGRYVVYGEIAAGGMATIHYGRLTGRGGFRREVAIKRLHKHLAADPEFVAMFLDEARLAARVVHPNVVPMLDLVSRADETFLVMDYVPGISLSHLVRLLAGRREGLPVGVAVGLLIGVLRGLHAAHEAKDDAGDPLEIVHRDVSPQNVLVGRDGVARLIDFGVAKAAVRLQTTREGHVKGKTAYMAPEQVIGALVTRRTDIYAATVVLWEVLTGQRLYAGDTDANILFRVVTAQPRPPSELADGLPPGLDAIVLRGMARESTDRYATGQEMADDLSRLEGVASMTEIAEWLQVVAGDLLDERAARVAGFERAATLPDLEPPVSASGTRAISAPTLTERSERVSERMSERAVRAMATTIDDLGRGSSTRPTLVNVVVPARAPVAAARVASPEPRRRWSTALAALAVFFLVALAFAGGWRMHRVGEAPAAAVEPAPVEVLSGPAPVDPVVSTPVAPASVAPAPVAQPLPQTAPQPVAPPVATTQIVQAAPPIAPSVTATPTAVPRVPVAIAPPATTKRDDSSRPAATPRATPRRTRPTNRPAAPDCAPYTVDAKGHTHFNPACL